MKRKNLYIMLSLLLMTIVMYTCVRFTFPTNDHHKTTTPSTSTVIVENTLANEPINTNGGTLDIDDADQKEASNAEAFTDTESADRTESDTIKDDVESTIVTVGGNTTQENDNSVKSVAKKADNKKDTKKSDQKETKEEKKAVTKKKKSKTKKEPKEEKVLTILSISDKQCKKENVGISLADPYVNIRKDASTEGEIVGKLYKNAAVNIIKDKKDWYYIASGNCKGYVKAEYIKTDLSEKEFDSYGTKVAVVTADGLNVRKKTDTESDRVDVVYQAESYPVLKESKEWVKIDIPDDGVKGYVLAEYVKVQITFKEAITIEEERALQKAEEEKKQEAANQNSSSPSSTNSSTQTTHGSSMNASVDSVKLLACLIQSEAGNQSYEGKLAVANVVLNRVRSSRYPNSISSVIYQSGQFSVASSGSLQKQLNQYSSYNTSSQRLSIQAAKDALSGVNNIGNRLYFNNYRTAINCGKGGGNSVRIDDHLFW